MDTRHEPRQFLSWKIVTADNFEQNLENLDNAFRLKKGTLRATLLPPESLAYLKKELALSFTSIYDPLNQDLLGITDDRDDDTETAELIAKANQSLKAELNVIFTHMTKLRDTSITTQITEIEIAKQNIISYKGCHAGNHALTLEVFKRNIAIALQSAAHEFYTHHEPTRKTPDQFNKIFKSISHINQHGVITHYDHAVDEYADCSLTDIQKMITDLIGDCHRLKEEGILHEITTQLLKINLLPGNPSTQNQPLLEIQHDNLHFTSAIHEIEEQSLHAAQTVRQTLRTLDKSVHEKLTAFDEDKTSLTLRNNLRKAMVVADNAIHASREKAAHRNEAANHSPGFWQRHPTFKRACIGALISVGVIGLAALITGIVFLTAGVAAAPIGAFFAMLVAKVGIGGTIGLGIATSLPVIGTGALIGALAKGKQPEVPHQSVTRSVDTTVRLLPVMGSATSSRTASRTPQQTAEPIAIPINTTPSATVSDDQTISLRRRK